MNPPSDSAIPAFIPESIIERRYEKVLDRNGNEFKAKDINRSPNVTDRIDSYIREHNSSLPVDSEKSFLWFSDNLSNRQRQKRAKRIIKDTMRTTLQIKWIDGSITFNNCQIEHGKEVEGYIEKINAIPLMSVYAQTERSLGGSKAYGRDRRKQAKIVPETKEAYFVCRTRPKGRDTRNVVIPTVQRFRNRRGGISQ